MLSILWIFKQKLSKSTAQNPVTFLLVVAKLDLGMLHAPHMLPRACGLLCRATPPLVKITLQNHWSQSFLLLFGLEIFLKSRDMNIIVCIEK